MTKQVARFVIAGLACLVAAVSASGAEAADAGTTPRSGPERFALWEGDRVPTAAQTPLLEDVRFSVVKPREPEKDGYDWLHGAAIIRHKGGLYTCWGNNPGKENTVTEINRGRRSTDDAKTWGPVEMIGPGVEENGVRTKAHSHGVFLSHKGTLWAFLARFGKGGVLGSKRSWFKGLCMEAFTLNEKTNRWESKGVTVHGFSGLSGASQDELP